MAEYELRAGAKIELVTPEEHREAFRPLEELVKQLKDQTPTIIKSSAEVSTDSSGNLGGGLAGQGTVVYTCPVGWEAFVHRLRITATGYTPNSPLTTGQVWISRNGPSISTVEYFLPVSGNVAPVVMTEGSNSAVQLLSGETLVVWGDGLPDSLNFFFALQLRLWPARSKVAIQ